MYKKMQADTIILELGSTRVTMVDPRAEVPYYRGTRFDRTGIILSLESGGHRYVQPWQRHYDPFSHDAVSGPAEEFLPPLPAGPVCCCDVGSEDGRSANRPCPGALLKIGVGLLRDNGEVYDRFKLYDVLDPGRHTVSFRQDAEAGEAVAGAMPSAVSFRHTLDGWYDYLKTVEIPAEGRLRLSHALRNDSAVPMNFHVYCHNFFILDGAPTGRATRFTFPFRPVGDWRAPYDSVRLCADGIVFERDLAPAETVFMGNLRPAVSLSGPVEQGAAGDREKPCRGMPPAAPCSSGPASRLLPEGYRFTLQNLDNGLAVEAACDRPMDYAVFWSNADVSCLEPYLPFHLLPGQTARWTLDYCFRPATASGRTQA